MKIESGYYRPTEVDTLIGDSELAKKKLGWKAKITTNQLIEEMVNEDLIRAKQEIASQVDVK